MPYLGSEIPFMTKTTNQLYNNGSIHSNNLQLLSSLNSSVEKWAQDLDDPDDIPIPSSGRSFLSDIASLDNLKHMAGRGDQIPDDKKPSYLRSAWNFATTTPLDYPLRSRGHDTAANILNYGAKGIAGASALASGVMGLGMLSNMSGNIHRTGAELLGEKDKDILSRVESTGSGPRGMWNLFKANVLPTSMGGDPTPIRDAGHQVAMEQFPTWLQGQMYGATTRNPKWLWRGVDAARSMTPLGLAMTLGIHSLAKPVHTTEQWSMNRAIDSGPLNQHFDLAKSTNFQNVLQTLNKARSERGKSDHPLTVAESIPVQPKQMTDDLLTSWHIPGLWRKIFNSDAAKALNIDPWEISSNTRKLREFRSLGPESEAHYRDGSKFWPSRLRAIELSNLSPDEFNKLSYKDVLAKAKPTLSASEYAELQTVLATSQDWWDKFQLLRNKEHWARYAADYERAKTPNTFFKGLGSALGVSNPLNYLDEKNEQSADPVTRKMSMQDKIYRRRQYSEGVRKDDKTGQTNKAIQEFDKETEQLEKKLKQLEKKSYFNRDIKKWAALKPDVTLQPHQQKLYEEAQDQPVRKILMHSLGSGKSGTGISVAEASRLPYTFVSPAALRENTRKEIDKFTDKTTPSSVMSYTQIARGDPVPNSSTLIFDEAHRLRNPRSQQTEQAQRLADKARSVALLTGTPIVNSPGDIAPLLSIVKGDKISPEEFEDRYIDYKKTSPGFINRLRGIEPGESQDVKNIDELKALMRGHIDYYSPDKPLVPTNFEDHTVEMGPDQTKVYKAIYDQLPWTMRWKMKHQFPLSRSEFTRLQSFLTGPRQVALSTLPFLKDKDPNLAYEQSTKLQKAMGLLQDKLKDPRSKALIFSNFIDAGLKPYSAALDKANIPHGMFYGALNDKQRKKLVDDYNTDKIRVALLGPAGAEGLSFKGTQLVQLLDPHWNNVRTRQQQGRGIRFDSHTDLPEELRNVTVQRFISQLPLGTRDKFLQRLGLDRTKSRHGTDDYLRLMSNRKDQLNQQFIDILKDVGSEHAPTPKMSLASNSRNHNQNHQPEYEDNLATTNDEKSNRKGVLARLYSKLFGQDKQSDHVPLLKPIDDLDPPEQELELKPSPLPDPLIVSTKKRPNDYIAKLRQAKDFSDMQRWNEKYKILIELMNQQPSQWAVKEDPKVHPKFIGLTHTPTGFRFHFPRTHLPPSVYLDIQNTKNKNSVYPDIQS
jgi:superfamily II DNA or RNA helicase